MKPFLLVQTRPEDDASDHEYEAFLKYSELPAGSLQRLRVQQTDISDIRLEDYSGILIGGSPFNVSDPEEIKSEAQKKAESQIFSMLDKVVEQDFPFLGTCYGIGLLVKHQNGTVTTTYGEQMDAVKIVLSQEGKSDPLLQGIKDEFNAFVAHKEACEDIPKNAVLLASSNWCPVHMIRVKSNVYATQFHPEWDAEGLEMRVRTYMNHGYFPPEEAQNIIAMGYSKKVTQPEKILRNFVERYTRA